MDIGSDGHRPMRSGRSRGRKKIAEFPFHTQTFGWGMIASSTKLSREKYELKERGGVISSATIDRDGNRKHGTQAVRLSWWVDSASTSREGDTSQSRK